MHNRKTIIMNTTPAPNHAWAIMRTIEGAQHQVMHIILRWYLHTRYMVHALQSTISNITHATPATSLQESALASLRSLPDTTCFRNTWLWFGCAFPWSNSNLQTKAMWKTTNGHNEHKMDAVKKSKIYWTHNCQLVRHNANMWNIKHENMLWNTWKYAIWTMQYENEHMLSSIRMGGLGCRERPPT